jgi:hypothetical protein
LFSFPFYLVFSFPDFDGFPNNYIEPPILVRIDQQTLCQKLQSPELYDIIVFIFLKKDLHRSFFSAMLTSVNLTGLHEKG